MGSNLLKSNVNDSWSILTKFLYDVWSFAFKSDIKFAYAPKSHLKKNISRCFYSTCMSRNQCLCYQTVADINAYLYMHDYDRLS